MGIMYVGLYQAVKVAKKDLLVVCTGYQVCGVMPSCSSAMKDLLVVCTGYQVCGVIQSCSRGNQGPASGL